LSRKALKIRFFGKCASYSGGDFTVYPKYDARNFFKNFHNLIDSILTIFENFGDKNSKWKLFCQTKFIDMRQFWV